MEGKINYLENRENYKNRIAKYIVDLRDSNNINEKINNAKKLWKVLFEAAMTYIDEDKRGYDRLFKFFDEYVEFEELIFASDSFYRDHTLHCLWVYFLGEYINKEKQFSEIVKDREEEINREKQIYEDLKSLEYYIDFKETLNIFKLSAQRHDYDDAVRCVAALTHDLGYPLKKIEKINKSISSVMPYFAINNFNEYNFQYSNVNQKYINEFIDFMATDIEFKCTTDDDKGAKVIDKIFELDNLRHIIRVKKEEVLKLNDEEKQVLSKVLRYKIKTFKSKSRLFDYENDFEQYKHGIMSAFLLMKNVKSFSSVLFNETYELELRDVNIIDFSSKLQILQAVSDHTNSGYHITSIDNTSSFLTLVDELEEFSRISRANQNREYVEQFCSTNIYMDDDWLNIDFIFDNTEIDNLDPERAFKGRCERFLSLFNIPKLSENLKIRLKCIGKLPYDNNTYTLEIARKYAKITINDEEKNIPSYLKSKEFYSREEYENN